MTQLIVNCPSCQKKVEWKEENRFRPFCSDRCKIIDLGEWADGKRYIPADAAYDDVTASDLKKDSES